jgi:hypothetical protein
MSMDSDRDFLQAIVASLADGLTIDWASLDHRMSADPDHRLLKELRVVARVAAAFRDGLEDLEAVMGEPFMHPPFRSKKR